MSSRPHVAFVVTALFGVSGGAERVLVDVANGLHRRGYDVTILTFQDRNGPSFYPLDFGIRRVDGKRRHARRSKAAPLASLSRVSQRNKPVAVATWLARYGPKTLSLRRLLRQAKPDVVIGFLPSSFPYMTIAATGLRMKTVASLHNVPERDLGGDPERWDTNPVDIAVRRRALRKADATTVLLPSFVEQLEDDVKPKVSVIPNMIHPYDGPLADVEDGEENTILAVGRLSGAKDHATLVRAWSKIEAKHPTWKLRIIGDGPLRKDLELLIESLEVDRVTLDEPTAEIDAAYTAARFLVMSSVHEGFGLVTAEAMACGLPVVGFSDCEGTNEIVVDDRNGLLVDPGDDRVAALSAAIERLVLDPATRRRLAAGAPATIEQFKPAAVLDTWEALIGDLTNGERS